MLLLTDGRVLVHEEPNCSGSGCVSTTNAYNNWYTLTPDSTVATSMGPGPGSVDSDQSDQLCTVVLQFRRVAGRESGDSRRRIQLPQRELRGRVAK